VNRLLVLLFVAVATTSAACTVMLQIGAGCCLRTQRSTNVRPVQQQAHWNQACRPQRLCQLCSVCECILIVVFRFHNLRRFVDEGYNAIYSMVTRPTLCQYCNSCGCVSVCFSVCLSQVSFLSKWLDGLSLFLVCGLPLNYRRLL